MATKKKTSSRANKKFSQKVRQIVKTDIFQSVAIASVLLNILFLVGVVVLTSTNTFDRRVYLDAKERYCENIDGVRERAKELGSDKAAISEWQISCIGKDFQPFYKEALDKYQAHINQH